MIIEKEQTMRKVLKWIGITTGVLIGLLLITVAAVYGISTYRFNRTYEVQVEAVEIPTDEASIEYGQQFAAVWPARSSTKPQLWDASPTPI